MRTPYNFCAGGRRTCTRGLLGGAEDGTLRRHGHGAPAPPTHARLTAVDRPRGPAGLFYSYAAPLGLLGPSYKTVLSSSSGHDEAAALPRLHSPAHCVAAAGPPASRLRCEARGRRVRRARPRRTRRQPHRLRPSPLPPPPWLRGVLEPAHDASLLNLQARDCLDDPHIARARARSSLTNTEGSL